MLDGTYTTYIYILITYWGSSGYIYWGYNSVLLYFILELLFQLQCSTHEVSHLKIQGCFSNSYKCFSKRNLLF